MSNLNTRKVTTYRGYSIVSYANTMFAVKTADGTHLDTVTSNTAATDLIDGYVVGTVR